MKQSIFDFATPYPLTLDNFVVGQNKELVESIKEIKEGNASYRGIYLFGPESCGKTHLLRAAVSDQDNALYIDAQQKKTLEGTHQGHRIVAIDNIHSLSPQGQIVLFDWFNRVHTNNVRFVLSGHKGPLFLNLREDLRTRVAMLLAFTVHPLADDDKVQVVRHYAQERGITLKNSTILYLLNRVDRNLSNLISWLNRLDHLSLSQKKHITAHFVKMAIEEQKSLPNQKFE